MHAVIDQEGDAAVRFQGLLHHRGIDIVGLLAAVRPPDRVGQKPVQPEQIHAVPGQAPAQFLDLFEFGQPDIILGGRQVVGVNVLEGNVSPGVNPNFGLFKEGHLAEAFHQFLGVVSSQRNNVHIS